jgi:hypothetical protein
MKSTARQPSGMDRPKIGQFSTEVLAAMWSMSMEFLKFCGKTAYRDSRQGWRKTHDELTGVNH